MEKYTSKHTGAEIDAGIDNANNALAQLNDISDWAKQPEKPKYTADEVGALPTSTKIPAKTSDISNDSGFITKTVGDLANYYLKSETLTRTEINALVSAIPKFAIQVVNSLPTTDISTTTVYLLKSGTESDLYTEYIYVNGAWEILGSQKVDLTGYALKTDIPTKLSALTNDAGFITKTVSDLVNYYTKDDIDKKGYLTEHQDISGKLDASKLPEAINDALAQAKASGEFNGADGNDGISPTAEITTIEGGKRITITDANGLKSADIMDGEDGSNGKDGSDGISPTVSVSKSGKVTTITITDKDGTKTATINDGTDGASGKDGTSVTVKSVSESTTDGGSNVVTFSDGKTLTVKNGSKGSTGAAGKDGADYVLTPADKAEIVQMVIESLGGNPVFGYVDANNNIIVSGNLADGSYSVKYEMEDGDTVDIGELVLDSNVYYSIASNLTNCTNSNIATQIVDGGSYSATITANSGYELKSVTVTMGGANVSATNGVINIASVTGNIVITAVAEEAAVTPTYTNFADPTSSDWKEGYRISGNIDGTSIVEGSIITNKITLQTNDIVYVEGINFTDSNNRQAAYNTSSTGGVAKAEAIASTWVSNGFVKDVAYDGNTLQLTNLYTVETQWRFSGLVTGTSNDVIIKIKRNGEWL